jgi:beta-lactamase class A
VTDEIARIFAGAGCTGTFCAQSLEGGPSVELDADRPMTPASVVKVPVALTVLGEIASGRLDGGTRVLLPAARRTPGPVGVSLMDDDVEMSLRDVTSLMLTISDNPSTDALIGVVGVDAVNDLLASLGLTDTLLSSDLMTMLDWRRPRAWTRPAAAGPRPATVSASSGRSGATRPGPRMRVTGCVS